MAPKKKPPSKVDELLSSGPPATDEAARRPISGGGGTIPAGFEGAQFFEGDDYLPASWPIEDRITLQRAMVKAGLFKKGTELRLGVWDDTTRQGYRQLLELANASRTDVGGALEQFGQGQQVKVGRSGELLGVSGIVALEEAEIENTMGRLRGLANEYALQVPDETLRDFAIGMTGG